MNHGTLLLQSPSGALNWEGVNKSCGPMCIICGSFIRCGSRL